MGIEGTCVNVIKAICDKPAANIIFNSEKHKVFSLRSGIRQGCPLLSHLFSIGLEGGKEEVKLVVFADDMTLYIENLKDSTKKS